VHRGVGFSIGKQVPYGIHLAARVARFLERRLLDAAPNAVLRNVSRVVGHDRRGHVAAKGHSAGHIFEVGGAILVVLEDAAERVFRVVFAVVVVTGPHVLEQGVVLATLAMWGNGL